ncbi:hypothetical protein ACOSQ3_013946 [Xanthoceras sorbifolium]
MSQMYKNGNLRKKKIQQYEEGISFGRGFGAEFQAIRDKVWFFLPFLSSLKREIKKKSGSEEDSLSLLLQKSPFLSWF